MHSGLSWVLIPAKADLGMANLVEAILSAYTNSNNYSQGIVVFFSK